MNTDWSDDIELIINKIRINSLKLAEYHRRTYLDLKNKIKYFRIPVLVLSAVNSVFSVGLNAFVAQSTVSVLNCLISLVCGIIVSVELFLQVQSRMDSSNSHSKDFYILTVDIFKTLSLDRSNRKCEAHTYLEEVYASYCKYKSGSSLLSVHLRDELEDIPINKNKQVYASPDPGPKPSPDPSPYLENCSVDIEYPEFGSGVSDGSGGPKGTSRPPSRSSSISKHSSSPDTPLSVADVLPEIPMRPVSLSVTTKTPTTSRNSSRRPSFESTAVRDIETGEIVG
jgi:hypothetical protein